MSVNVDLKVAAVMIILVNIVNIMVKYVLIKDLSITGKILQEI